MDNQEQVYEGKVKSSIRTDLAIEARELAGNITEELPGVKMWANEFMEGRLKITKVNISTEEGVEQLNKPIGNYITIESDDFKLSGLDDKEKMVELIVEELSQIIGSEHKTVLVVGLGNHNVTPDSLGPKVVNKMIVTRHLYNEIEEFESSTLEKVSALAPGVMGQTGMETVEVVKGVVDTIKPDLVIAIDALASRKTSRVNTTIQISDTGVHPGSGVGNKRKGITEETLGVKVIAVGVPTVVDAATIVYDAMDQLIVKIREQMREENMLLKDIHALEESNKYQLVKEVLEEELGDMFVTPKEIDEVIEKLSDIVSISLNMSIHSGISYEDVQDWLS